ncbi:DUF1616 domain-containing protein [Salinigranum halophilum]|uniref:DUF1616 domain-containing protein n=1 Tax=Salinigranum halophilum TaxID=2565931 RepID=UPI00115E54D5|nr:DUF1616 domain-containing protein [Salinigranum halophilum]
MDDDVRWSRIAPPWLRYLSADLTVVFVLTVLAVGAVFTPVVRDTPVRIIVGLPFLLFVPGYAVVSALFPMAAPDLSDDDSDLNSSSITGLERVALSFGVSIAIVPLIGLGLDLTPLGIRLVPVVLSISVTVFASTVVAAYRRQTLPPEERFSVPWRAWVAAGKGELFKPEGRIDGVLNILLVASLLLAAGSVGYAVTVPKEGDSFSEFYLLTENDEGELIADEYPSEFVAGESQSVVVGIDNQEHQPMEYTIIVDIHRVQAENNSTVVLERERLRTFEVQTEHNETWQRQHSISPEMLGDRLRVTYLLYRGDAPARPTPENAYREVHLWINVSSP